MIKAIWTNSIFAGFFKNFFCVLMLSFKETFLYKMFMKDDKGIFNNSFVYKLFSFFGSLVKKVNGFIAWLDLFAYLKPKKLSFNTVLNNSKILKLFQIPNLDYNIGFVLFLMLIFLAAIIPTMMVVVFVFIIFFFILIKKNLTLQKPIFTDALIGMYLIMLVYGWFISDSPDRLNILLVDFVFVGFYFAVRQHVITKEKVFNTITFFSLSGFLVCLYAFYQYISGDTGTQSWTDSQMFEDIGLRVYSTFQNPNVLGEYLLFLIPLCFAMILSVKKLLHKIIFGGILMCSLGTIFLTYSRGCWIGLILGIIVFTALLYRKVLVAAIVASPFSIFVIPDSILKRFLSIGNMNDSSTSYRVSIWNSTYSMLKNVWPSGIGLGAEAYARASLPYSHSGVIAQHAHNSYLHIFSETGLFGIILFVILIFWVIRSLFLSYKNAKDRGVQIICVSLISGMAGFLVQGFFDNTFYNYRMYLIFFIMLALSTAVSEVVKREEQQ